MHRSFLAAAACFALSPQADAGFSQSTTPAPGGFTQAGVYTSTSGGGFTPGADMSAAVGTGQQFRENAFSGNSGASAVASYNGPPNVSNNAQIIALLGIIRTTAANSTPTTNSFPAALSNGGWNETFTVNNPALTGQSGFMTFRVRARGQLRATGLSGSALVYLASYKDRVLLTTSGNPYFNPGNSDSIGTTDQYGRWGIATYGVPPQDSRTVDGVVTFSAPITFGQSFTLGVYARASAGLRSSGGLPTDISTAQVDFYNGGGVNWDGIAAILTSNGQPVSGSTIISGSGVDWTGPIPLPACGTADFNGDGDIGTDADIEAFFTCLAGDCCPTCFPGGSDFNADGDVGTDADIESFFRVLAGSNC